MRRSTDRGLIVIRALLLAMLAPLAAGLVAVTYQDALMTHLPARVATAEALRAGELPVVHPYQSCGQPLAGNPNFGTFFPDTLLLLALPPHIAVGLRFALAAALAYVGARRWAGAEGVARGGAEIAALAFALSGPFLSAWRFYNSGMALALAPFVLAAAAKVCERPAGPARRRAVAELGVFAALEALAGEPVIALLTGLAVAVRALGREVLPRARRLALAAGVAALLAAPQIAATLQMYPASTRSRAPFSYAVATSTSVHPVRALELVNPFPFGRPDRTGETGFSGHAFFDNHSPYLWTLHLGGPTLLLLALFARPHDRRERRWWILAVAAAILSLGYHLPFARVLFPLLSLDGRLRFPVKWWYVVALALVPIVAHSASRALAGLRPSGSRLGLAGALMVAGLLAIPFTDTSSGLVRAALVVSALAGLLLAVAVRLTHVTAGVVAWCLFIPLAVAGSPLALAYVDRPPRVPPRLDGGRVMERIAGTNPHPRPGVAAAPDALTREVFRRATAELWAVAGGASGIGYAFDRDPDGSYFDGDRLVRKAVDDTPWPARVPALRMAGVSWIATDEALPEPFRETARLGHDGRVRLWAVPGRLAPVRIATRVRAVDLFGEVGAAHAEPAFDPATDTVLVRDPLWPGAAPATVAPAVDPSPARLVSAQIGTARLRAEVETGAPAVVVWSRSFFPAWRATVDGAAVPVLLADGHLVGVAVPAGHHVVEVTWPAWPIATGVAAALCGMVLVVLLLRR